MQEILFADDDRVMRKSFCGVFAAEGFSVRAVKSGEECFDRAGLSRGGAFCYNSRMASEADRDPPGWRYDEDTGAMVRDVIHRMGRRCRKWNYRGEGVYQITRRSPTAADRRPRRGRDRLQGHPPRRHRQPRPRRRQAIDPSGCACDSPLLVACVRRECMGD